MSKLPIVIGFIAAASLGIFLARIVRGILLERIATRDKSLQQATDLVLIEASVAAEGVFLIHMPEGICPDGWMLIENAFIEKDRTRRHGCLLIRTHYGATSIDYLLPGESVGFEFSVYRRE